MADVDLTTNTAIAGVPRIVWEGLDQTDDTGTPLLLRQQYGLAASVQAVGTFGSASITMQVSNDGTNWATVSDLQGDDVTMTAATECFEFTVSGVYIRPLLTGGSSSDIDVILVLRGPHAL